jgi:N-methylhydantoinase B
MKFSANGYYIESYQKCPNCGILMYANAEEDKAKRVEHNGEIYCSQRCVDWSMDRDARRAKAEA